MTGVAVKAVRGASRASLRHPYIDIPPPPDGWIHWWSWGDINEGNCTMTGSVLHLYADGGFRFAATTSAQDNLSSGAALPALDSDPNLPLAPSLRGF
jgi:hypothetical protein